MERDPLKEAPNGMNLRPQAPFARMVSKRAGRLAILILGGFVGLLIYGILGRQDIASEFAKRGGPDPDKRVTGARDAGKQFSTPSPVADGSTEKLEPPPLTFLPQPPPPSSRPLPEVGAAAAVPPAPRRQQPAVATISPSRPPQTNTSLDRHREALDAGTGVNMGQQSTPLPSAANDMKEIGGLLNALGANSTGSPTKTQAAPVAMPNTATIHGSTRPFLPEEVAADGEPASSKDDFLRKLRKSGSGGGGDDNYVQSTRVRALTPFEIKAGWDIPAVLEQEINSDLPGEIRALVRESVYDTATGRHLLIPQGSRLVGTYDSRVAYAQNALLVAWNRIIFPDGSSVDLEGMASQGIRGQSGLRGKVNNHYGRLFGTAVLSTAFSVAAVIGQTRRQTLITVPSAQDAAASAAASEIARLGSAITRKNLNVQPTIRILTGTRFSVRVHRDLMFEGPYRPFER